MYQRLATALAPCGREPVRFQISSTEGFPSLKLESNSNAASSELAQVEAELVEEIYQNYGALESWQLSALTRKGSTPWKQVFADGVGRSRDIPHDLIRIQFAELLRQSEGSQERP
jgi:uncharacterized phage-associated protein